MTKTTSGATHTFRELPIAEDILAILDQYGFVTPTPIQHQAIPPAIEGKDVIGVAQTGTGKTLSFGIPLVHRLLENDGQGLILLPTRELAIQAEEEISRIGKPFGMRTAVLIGGSPMGPQLRDLRNGPHLIVATPGRLNDHLEQRTLVLDDVTMVVLDEADRMLDMGFWPQIKTVISMLRKERQTLLFSATLSKEIMELATKHMKLPTRIEVVPPGTTAERVTQEFFIVAKEDKIRLLESVLGEHKGSVIVFSRTKHGASRIKRGIQHMGYTAAEIHSDRSLGQRREALEGFKKGKYSILVATDIAARGIDVKDIALVVNYDLPQQAEDYVHRIGRTARAGKEGHAISFVMPSEKRDLRDIERLIRKPIPLSRTPELPPARIGMPQGDAISEERPVVRSRAPLSSRPRKPFHKRAGQLRRKTSN